MNLSQEKTVEEILAAGLEHLGLDLNTTPFIQYLQLLEKWNLAFNLTAVRAIDAMVIRHILDSLSIVSWVRGPHVLDIGSGAGLPGIPLALARPEIDFVLIDSNGKKTRFIEEVCRKLKLDNVTVIQSRVEALQVEKKFDSLTSRAFSDLTKMISLSQHLVSPSGQWLAMKGRVPKEELTSIQKMYEIMPYKVFGMEAEERCCIIIKN